MIIYTQNGPLTDMPHKAFLGPVIDFGDIEFVPPKYEGKASIVEWSTVGSLDGPQMSGTDTLTISNVRGKVVVNSETSVRIYFDNEEVAGSGVITREFIDVTLTINGLQRTLVQLNENMLQDAAMLPVARLNYQASNSSTAITTGQGLLLVNSNSEMTNLVAGSLRFPDGSRMVARKRN